MRKVANDGANTSSDNNAASEWLLASDIEQFDKRYRVNLVNGLSGFKSAHLVGTCDEQGVDNLAVFSSVFHLGADPALMGMIVRPDSVDRHTLSNIRSSGYYTLNHVHEGIFQQAHQTSARYSAEVSEFAAVGLTPENIDSWPAPFVKEAWVKVLLALEEIVPIKANGTLLVIGRVQAINFPAGAVNQQGVIDYQGLDEVAVVGLDSYYQASSLARLSYAKPDKDLVIT